MNTGARMWWNPTVALSIGLVVCMIRVAIKLGVGIPANSPLLTGDGYHNIGDAGYILAALFIMWIVHWKRDIMHAGENMGVMFQFAVAWLLAFLALVTGYQSFLGLFPCPSCEQAASQIAPFLSGMAPKSEAESSYPLIIGALLVTVAISWALSVYHVRAGERGGYAALITIGKETRSDMLVEFTILGGFIGALLFGAPWIEYVLGLIVMVLILRTAWELFIEAHNTFLQVSIGEEFTSGVKQIVAGTYGVERIVKLEAYPVLQVARIKVWVETNGSLEANADIQRALTTRLHAFAKENGFSECRPDVYFVTPDTDWHRTATAIIKTKKGDLIADSLEHATHVRIADVEHGEEVSAEDIPAPRTHEELVALLVRKHVRSYRAWGEDKALTHMLGAVSIATRLAPTIVP